MSALTSLLFNSTSLLSQTPHLSKWIKGSTVDDIAWAALRVVLVGAVVAALRKAFSYLYAKGERALFPTAYISSGDTAYLWIMAWIAQDTSAQGQIKDFQLSTSEWRQVRGASGNTLKSAKAAAAEAASVTKVGEHNASWTSKDIIGQVLPTYHQTITIKHKNEYLWITRKIGSFARSNLRSVDHIQIRTSAFHPHAIKNFLVAAHAQYHSKEEQELLIFHAQRINPVWQKPVSRPARPWSSVILPGNTKEDLLEDIERFLSDKETSWYAARGIPHRRGYLFHGEPGAGKTTLATAIVSKLRLDIYVVNPAQRGMDDAKLSKLFRDCPAKSIILIEDIDCVFPKGRGRGFVDGQVSDDGEEELVEFPSTHVSPTHGGSHDLAPSTVTLSGLLNAIDGVSSQEGCILIASTNHPKRLDPALSRAGRFDVQIPFFNATPEQAHALFLHFFPVEDFVTPDTVPEDEKSQISGQDDIDRLASRFTDTVFPTGDAGWVGGREGLGVSMAALQAFLLRFKDAPWTAAEEAKAWVEGFEVKKPRAKRTKA